MLQYFLQRDAVDTGIGEVQAIDAHSPEAILQVRIEQLRNSNYVFAIVDTHHALLREPPTGLIHEKPAVATEIQDGIALEAIENLHLAVR